MARAKPIPPEDVLKLSRQYIRRSAVSLYRIHCIGRCCDVRELFTSIYMSPVPARYARYLCAFASFWKVAILGDLQRNRLLFPDTPEVCSLMCFREISFLLNVKFEMSNFISKKSKATKRCRIKIKNFSFDNASFHILAIEI